MFAQDDMECGYILTEIVTQVSVASCERSFMVKHAWECVAVEGTSWGHFNIHSVKTEDRKTQTKEDHCNSLWLTFLKPFSTFGVCCLKGQSIICQGNRLAWKTVQIDLHFEKKKKKTFKRQLLLVINNKHLCIKRVVFTSIAPANIVYFTILAWHQSRCKKDPVGH